MDVYSFVRSKNGDRSKGRRRRGIFSLAFLATTVLSFAFVTNALAVFNPTFEVTAVNPANADSVAQVVTRVTQNPDQRERPIGSSIVKFPVGWKVNNPAANAVTLCSLDDYNEETEDGMSTRCPDSSIIGHAVSDARIGNLDVHAEGDMYLLESNANDDAVHIGAFLPAVLRPGTPPIPYRVPADVTLEGALGQERIVVNYHDLPPVVVRTFDLTINGGANGIIRTSASCGQGTFDAEFTAPGEAAVRAQDQINLRGNCQYDFPGNNIPGSGIDGYTRGGALDFNVFRPVLNVRLSQGNNPTTTLALKDLDGNPAYNNRMNNGTAGFQSMDSFNISFDSNVRLKANAVQRCGANHQPGAWANGAEPCRASDIGTTVMEVRAAQQDHTIRGNVYLSAPLENGDPASLRLVYPNPPKRLNSDGNLDTRDPIVLRARLMSGPGNTKHVFLEDIPTVYEIREFYLEIEGRVGNANVITRRAGACDNRVFGDFGATFWSDRGGLSLFFASCSRNANWQLPRHPTGMQMQAGPLPQQFKSSKAKRAKGKAKRCAKARKATKKGKKRLKAKAASVCKKRR